MPEQALNQSPSSISFFAKCLGMSILVVALAGAYRVATGSTGFSMSGDKDGFKITLEQAQQELKQASEEVSEAQDQVQLQSAQLADASKALSEREAQLNALVATLQQQVASAAAVTPEVKSSLLEMNRIKAFDVAKLAKPVDARTFDRVDARLQRVDDLSKTLKLNSGAR
jgi:chromosome segregation ATPase